MIENTTQTQTANDLVQPVENPEVLGPSTAENQIATPDEERVELKTLDPERIQNLKKQGFTQSAAEMFIIKEQKRKLQNDIEKKEKKRLEDDQKFKKNLSELNEEESQIKQALEDAAELGINSSSLKNRLNEIEGEKNKLTESQGFKPFPTQYLDNQEIPDSSTLEEQAVINPDAPADREDIKEANADANTVSQEEVFNKAKEINEEQSRIKAEELLANSEIEKQKQRVEEAQKRLGEEDLKLEKVDPNRFWKTRSTWQKIMAGIAVTLGGGKGQAVINNLINQDIEAQKLNNKQKLAKRNAAINLVNNQIDRLTALTNDNIKRQKLQLTKSQLQMQQAALNQKRLQEELAQSQEQELSRLLGSGKPLNRMNLELLSIKKPRLKIRERAIDLGDKGTFLARTESEANKLRNEVIPEAKKSADSLNKLEELVEKIGFFDKINPFSEEKEEAKVLRESLKGSLRLEIFGPGVMTDTERAIADKIIADPAAITKLDKQEIAKIRILKNKLNQGLRDRLRLSGIILPKNANELRIEQMQKNNPKLTRPEIINALIKKGFWNVEEGIY